jgi:hypothetical protein
MSLLEINGVLPMGRIDMLSCVPVDVLLGRPVIGLSSELLNPSNGVLVHQSTHRMVD